MCNRQINKLENEFFKNGLLLESNKKISYCQHKIIKFRQSEIIEILGYNPSI